MIQDFKLTGRYSVFVIFWGVGGGFLVTSVRLVAMLAPIIDPLVHNRRGATPGAHVGNRTIIDWYGGVAGMDAGHCR